MTGPNESGRANRVAPDGSVHAVAARGELWGNRGRLLNARGEPARHSLGRNWIICVLDFNSRQRTQWRPDRLTELYFLDEPTGLAAGHRPCGECRHRAYQRYKALWTGLQLTDPVTAASIDRRLHAERFDGREHLTHRAQRDDLPDGVIVEAGGGFRLIRGTSSFAWDFAGYTDPRPRSELPVTVTVRTPPATVAVLRAGYAPVLHPSVLRHP